LPAEVISHVNTFEAASGLQVRLDISFVDYFAKEDRVAVCYRVAGAGVAIVINRPKWEVSSYERQENIMMHELGHCVLNREHYDAEIYDTKLGQRVPASIMNTAVLPEYIYVSKRDYYLMELFSVLN
jgi:Zn-dependent peptidase ImmA (M78 family)